MGCFPGKIQNENNNMISQNKESQEQKIENNKMENNKEQSTLKPKSMGLKTYFSKTITSKKKKEIIEDFSEYDLLLGHQLDTLSIKTEIFLQCKNLPKITSSLNSFIIVYRNEGESWVEIGQTEIYRYSINPSYIKSFIMNYHFEENSNSQKLKFEINFKEHDEIINIDNVIVTLKDILTSKNQEYIKLIDPDKKSKLIIRGQQKKTSTKYIQMKLGLRGPKVTRNKIYCRVSKKDIHGDFIPIFVTNEKEHNPSKEKSFYWDIVEFENDRINYEGILSKIGDVDTLKFQIFELDKRRRPKSLTEVDMTFDELKIRKEFQLKKIKDEYHYLLIEDIKEIDKFTLFSFLVSGMEYECNFFLDLSRSKLNIYVSDKLNNSFTKKFLENERNKEEKNEESLIYRPLLDLKRKDKDKYQGIETLKLNVILKNEEEKAKNEEEKIKIREYLQQIREEREKTIITKKSVFNDLEEEYEQLKELTESLIKDQFELDSDNRCSLFGFGCNIPPNYDINCNNIACNLDILNPEVEDSKLILEGYNKCMSNYNLGGPVCLIESLEHFIQYVNAEKFDDKNQKYHVGFFIVSGEIHDSVLLFKFLNENSNLPFSLIICSIGNEFNSKEFEEKIEDYRKENQNLRWNFIYINFNDYIGGFTKAKIKEKNKLLCKFVYNQINKHFIKFIEMNKVIPFDAKNISNKNTPDFIEFKKKKMFQKYIIPKFLINMKEKLMKDILDLQYTEEIFQTTFGKKIPTFDRHYIINQLNRTKITMLKHINQQEQLQKKKSMKKFIKYENSAYIDERDYYFNMKKDKEKEKQSKVKEEKEISDTICNLCNENKINIVFQYCKHKYCCVYCTSLIKNDICPICKKTITYYVTLYNV